MFQFQSLGAGLKDFVATGMPHEVEAALARFAKEDLRRAISSGQASGSYARWTSGVQGAPEESVRLENPVILYVFSAWKEIVLEAIKDLRSRFHSRSGRYAESFRVIVNGAPVTNYDAIPGDATVMIFNVQPYTRLMEVGGNKAGKRHFERTKNALSNRHRGQYDFDLTFRRVEGGFPGVPYILKHSQGRRKDRQAGMPITYPTLIIRRTGV
ncbi:hypothetical protein [Ensifer soli]|uniref:hypothetical protein n=1 Tax=Ciceribacter sp. sgz301302 TaxID=3342379 RepID=UPI0035B73A16